VSHAELEITAELVRDLVRDQHPDLADHQVRLGARGWANQLWRLGDDLAVRLPWAAADSDVLLRKEHAWVPGLAPHLPLPVPVPQRFGEPSERFPRPWLITTWVPGTAADRAPVTRAADAAESLAAFLTALHQPAPDGAPAVRDRGGPLADQAEGVVKGLAAAWILLPDGAIDRFHAAYRSTLDAATLRRARGWAVWRALGCLFVGNDPGPGGKPTWGPPANASLQRLIATMR
jgi:hypothetical protein